jgi:hypothetical protein
MMKYVPLVVTLAATLGAAIFTPAWLAAHPQVVAGLAAAAQILHAVLPSIFGYTNQN